MENRDPAFITPLVSVVIPAYNAESLIKVTLESVFNQTYSNLEVIVVDDGSQDRTAAIVEELIQQYPQLVLICQPNKGVAVARNTAIARARGEYIATLDADDIWHPTKLEKQVQCFLKSDPSVGLVYAWSVFMDDAGNYTGGYMTSEARGEVYIDLLIGNFVGHASSPLIRRECFTKLGGYNSELRAQNAQGCEDLDLYLRIAEHYQFELIPEFLIGYRQTTASMSCNLDKMLKSYLLVIEAAKQRRPYTPEQAFRWSLSNYYVYFGYKEQQIGHHGRMLNWFLKAIYLDPLIALNSGLYKMFISSLLKFLTYPVNVLIWSEHQQWMLFKENLKKRLGRNYTWDGESFSGQSKPHFLSIKRLHQALVERRRMRLIKISQEQLVHAPMREPSLHA